MKCAELEFKIDDLLDGELASAERAAVTAHVEACERCRRRLAAEHALRRAVRSLGVEGPRPGFFERALRRAAPRDTRPAPRWWPAAGALAAGVVIWLAAQSLPWQGSTTQSIEGVSLSLHETRTVRLALNSERALTGVTVHLVLPEGIELAGYPGLRELRWQTDLAQGVNLLPLPVTAVALKGGTLVARLEHGERSNQLAVRIVVNEPGRGALDAPTLG